MQKWNNLANKLDRLRTEDQQTEEDTEVLTDMPDIERVKPHHREKFLQILHILLVLLCFYIVFLIYGVSVTTYEYNSAGEPVPQRMTSEDIAAGEEYGKIQRYYIACRSLYEKTLLLDYRLGAGEEDPLTIAPEYDSLLDTVDTLSIQTDALTVSSAYTQVKSMLLSWIQDDIAVYLQNMSAAISQNDTDTANNALQDKDRVYDNFMLITQNMASLGADIRGADLSDIRTWTPESYIDEEINGVSP